MFLPSNINDFTKVFIFIELQRVLSFILTLDLSEDNIVLRSDFNLTLLEMDLGFITRSLPVIFNSLFFPSDKVDDVIVKAAIDQRKTEHNRIENFFRSVNYAGNKLKFNYSLLKEFKSKILFRSNFFSF